MSQLITKNVAYLEALKQRVLIYDGAMGTTLQTMNLTEQDFGGKSWWAATIAWC